MEVRGPEHYSDSSLNSSGAAVLDLGGTTITSSVTGLANGAWHHIATTVPASGTTGDVKLYVNGTGTNGSGSTTIGTLDQLPT